jgi:rSAM/selenodomain-associated transferase 1
VKTRLAREIGADTAARLYAAFLRDTLATCGAVRSAQLFVAYDPPASRTAFAALAPAAVLVEQPDGDLGHRLRAAIDAAFERGFARVVVVGSDTPHLADADVALAFDELDRHDVVVGPALDGGYYLLGLARAAPRLVEDIAWSTSTVLAATLERARSLGLSCALGPSTFDVDEPLDLVRLRAHLDSAAPEICPHTRRVLAQWDASTR